MTASAAPSLDWLFHPPPSDTNIDRKALAGLLVELARNVEPEIRAPSTVALPMDPRLEQLRGLLVGRELETLSRLSRLVEDPEQFAAAVGEILPTAIANASSGTRLGQVLTPALEKAAQSSIRSDPRNLIDILHPLIAPAIRKSIGEAIDGTFQSLNETLRHSLTWRGLKWRFEAWRTGIPFAEIVLKHTLVYQVEHVFLIHRNTGLLISHVAAEDAASQDPQLVSSMLSAIQDFVRDSFQGAEHQGLDTLHLGALRLWSEPGPYASLVAVIRGNPPEALHERLSQVLTQIHAERRQALESFAGDSAGFADVDAHLAELAALRQRAPHATRRRFPWLLALLALALLALAGAAGWRWWQSQRLEAAEQRLWADGIALLRVQPGIVLTEAVRQGDGYLVSGLRDPLAVDPDTVLQNSGIDTARVIGRWAPYQALDPEFVLKRLEASLDPPQSVTLAVEGGHVAAMGSAPSSWIERARLAARLLPAGSPGLDLSAVHNADQETIAKLREATRSLRESIQSRWIHFDSNEPLPAAGQDAVLDALTREIKELASLSASLRVPARVTLTGHSDDTGKGNFNLSLSLARAGAVLALLKKRGVDPDLLVVRGAGPLEPLDPGSSEAARAANRRVSFTVGIEDQP